MGGFRFSNKISLILIIVATALICIQYQTPANDILPNNAGDAVDLSGFKNFLAQIDEDIQNYLPRLDPNSWGVSGPAWDLPKIAKGIARYFFRELVFNLKLLGELLLLAVALAILQNLKHAFEGETIGEIAFGICFLIVMGIIINSFRVTFMIARGAVTEVTGFMYAIIPLVFTLIAAGGGLTTATLVHPLLVSSVGVISGVVSNLVFPLIMFGGVLSIVNYLVEGFQVNKLADLFKTVALGILGLAMVVFIGLVTIRRFAGAVADSMTLRTAKYFSSTLLPVVGGALSDTMEMAAGCSMVLKSGLGLYGLGVIILIIIFPLAKILAVAFIFRLSGAVIQPLSSNRMADALQAVGETFFNLFGSVAIVGLMFFVALSILVGAAGGVR